jgi:SMC interacting uncharacterized protein involved in chromosome segregation
MAKQKFDHSYEEVFFNVEFDLEIEMERGHNLINLVTKPENQKNLLLNLKKFRKDLTYNQSILEKIKSGVYEAFDEIDEDVENFSSKFKETFNNFGESKSEIEDEIERKKVTKQEINKLIDYSQEMNERKNSFIEEFKDFFGHLIKWKENKLKCESRMKGYIDALEMAVEELHRKAEDFKQINNIVQMLKVVIEKENQHIKE